jgi:hypothetical protein
VHSVGCHSPVHFCKLKDWTAELSCSDMCSLHSLSNGIHKLRCHRPHHVGCIVHHKQLHITAKSNITKITHLIGTLSGFSKKDHITSRAVDASVTIFTLADPIWKALTLTIASPRTEAYKRIKEMLNKLLKYNSMKPRVNGLQIYNWMKPRFSSIDSKLIHWKA